MNKEQPYNQPYHMTWQEITGLVILVGGIALIAITWFIQQTLVNVIGLAGLALIAGGFLALATAALKTGRITSRGLRITRDTEPFGFWLSLVIQLIMGVILAIVTIILTITHLLESLSGTAPIG